MKALVLHSTGLHLGYLGCYGNDWVDTPWVDRLAAQGVVFDQHIADCVGGQRSAWTGCYELPSADRQRVALPQATSLQEILARREIAFVTIEPEKLRKKGVVARTVQQLANVERGLVWVDLPPLFPPWRIRAEFLERYFKQLTDDESDADDYDAEEATEEAPSTPLDEPTIGPLDERDFALLDRLQLTYAGAVTQLDAQIGEWLEELERHELDNQVLVIVTADRGLALGEHGIVGDYRPWLHEEIVHVPLIVRLPEVSAAGRRVSALTQPVDLLPTLLDAVGAPRENCHGCSLVPLALGQVDRFREYACTGWELDDRLEWVLRTPEWAFVLPVRTKPGDRPREPQLYVKPDDRWEVNNVAHHNSERSEHLEKLLRAFMAATQDPEAFEPPPLTARE